MREYNLLIAQVILLHTSKGYWFVFLMLEKSVHLVMSVTETHTFFCESLFCEHQIISACESKQVWVRVRCVRKCVCVWMQSTGKREVFRISCTSLSIQYEDKFV